MDTFHVAFRSFHLGKRSFFEIPLKIETLKLTLRELKFADETITPLGNFLGKKDCAESKRYSKRN